MNAVMFRGWEFPIGSSNTANAANCWPICDSMLPALPPSAANGRTAAGVIDETVHRRVS